MRSFTITAADGTTVAFNSGSADGNGCWWLAPDLDGWDGPDVKFVYADRPGVPGEMANSGQPVTRTLSIKNGVLIAPTEAARTGARDQLAHILATMGEVETPGLVVVTEPAPGGGNLVRKAQAYLNQKPAVTDRPPGPVVIRGALALPAGWVSVLGVVLLAPDPLRYASPDTVSAFTSTVAVALNNVGSAPAPLVVALTTPANPTTIAHAETGRTVHLAGAMPAALTVDVVNRSVLDGGGADRYDLVTSSPDQWFELLGGVTNHVTVTGAAGTITWAPAWW